MSSTMSTALEIPEPEETSSSTTVLCKGRLSQGKQCAAFDCTSRAYKVVCGKRQPTSISFFSFPSDRGEIAHWCNLIKRTNGKDGFKVTSSTVLCEKHSPGEYLLRALGTTRQKRHPNGKPALHPWNDFSLYIKSRPRRRSRDDCQQTSASFESSPDSEHHGVDTFMDDSTEPRSYESLVADIVRYESQVRDLENIISALSQELTILKSDETKESSEWRKRFVAHVLSADELCRHYTGFPNTGRLHHVFEFLNTGSKGDNVTLYNSQNTVKKDKGKRGRPRELSPFDSFILLLCKLQTNMPSMCKLRRGLSTVHLALLFDASESTISNYIITFLNYSYLRLGSISIWPSMDSVKKVMPQSLALKFPNLRAIIDCAEFRTAVPSSLYLHKLMYSNYKSSATVKVLFAIIPGGGLSFISPVYPGSISDREIVIKSGVLNPSLWDHGDAIMADRGFTVEDKVNEIGVQLIIPAFLKGREELSLKETIETQQIANERIHVERMIQRLKCFRIFDRIC